MQLSKKESKFRQKLICETNWDKVEQKNLDNFAKENNYTYSKLYKMYRLRYPCGLFAGAAIRKLSKKMISLGLSVKKCGDTFKTTTEILSELSEKWNEVATYERN